MTTRIVPPALTSALRWAHEVVGVRSRPTQLSPSSRQSPLSPAAESPPSEREGVSNQLTGQVSEDEFSRALAWFVQGASKRWRFGLKANEAFWFEGKPVGFQRSWWYLKDSAPKPSLIIEDMVGKNAKKYRFDCASFAYFAQLYAILRTLGPQRFDAEVERHEITFDFSRYEQSRFRREIVNVETPEEIPVGSDIYMTVRGVLTLFDRGHRQPIELRLLVKDTAWAALHVLKLSDDSYYGWPFEAPSGFGEVVRSYASVILRIISDYERKFVQFSDHTDQKMANEDKVDYLVGNNIQISKTMAVPIVQN